MPTIEEVRAQYPQYQDMSDVQLAGALHQKFYADMDPQAFAEKIGLKPDKYQQAAIDEQADLKAKGIDAGAGLTRRLAHGATLGADSTIMAAAMTPLEMFKRGINPAEAYNYTKAREDQIMGDARKNTGALGTGAEILGGGVSGAGLAQGGLTTARFLAPEAGLLARSGASAADAAGLGAFSGAMEGNGLAERGTNALKGAALGGLVGGALPPALSILGAAASPIISNIRARLNPEGFARSQVARAVSESGVTPAQISQRVSDADAAGQGMFTAADAMGNSGQRMLSTVARSPGEGRTDLVNFLNTRQAGQGERLSQITDEALGASGTARKTADELTKTAQTQSAPFYEAALSRKPVWNERIQQFFDDPVTKSGLREGVAVQRLESLAAGKKFDPKDYAITGFNEAGDPIMSGVPNMRTINLIKKGWDKQLEGYRDSTTGKLMLDEYGRALDNVRRTFLKEIDSVNPDYAQARSLYAGPAQARDAVNMGGKAASRGRADDNMRQFNAMTGPNQQGYRIGYADKLSEGFERSAEGVNKARGLTSDKRIGELSDMSLHQGPVAPGGLDPLQQRIARENTMFETRNAALGGSKTADNLADAAAMGVDPTLVGHIVSGNWTGALKSALASGSNALSGNTPAVRKAVADILLTRGQNASPAAFQKMIDETVQRIRQVQNMARSMGRGAAGGLAVTGPSQNRR
jgi:hypothetical protein